MYCKKCGNKLNETDKFCSNCGNLIEIIKIEEIEEEPIISKASNTTIYGIVLLIMIVSITLIICISKFI